MARALHRWIIAAAFATAAMGLALLRLMPGDSADMLGGICLGVAVGLLFVLLLRRQLPNACDTAPLALRRRYSREMMIAMSAYVVLLVLSILLLKRVEGTALRACIALLPVPPIAMTLRAMIRYIRDADELQQRIELQAVSFAAAFVSLLYLTGGLLQSARVLDVAASAAMIWVFPLVCLAYGLAKIVVSRRYG
ncbi:hypothetical protein GXB84_11245 [Stenotrophomonas acidaminiphila]|uniref:hypothetical protein n=1 Tax=Stenotrophomonas acidaminiphila TaxID=128780 RepID=UPI0013760C17|nr:hypothetical protein [Stenotrophomonas acidaminiphila]NCT87909.1 hypothetical protein [Stenotrophomonas acidaminiphila]